MTKLELDTYPNKRSTVRRRKGDLLDFVDKLKKLPRKLLTGGRMEATVWLSELAGVNAAVDLIRNALGRLFADPAVVRVHYVDVKQYLKQAESFVVYAAQKGAFDDHAVIKPQQAFKVLDATAVVGWCSRPQVVCLDRTWKANYANSAADVLRSGGRGSWPENPATWLTRADLDASSSDDDDDAGDADKRVSWRQRKANLPNKGDELSGDVFAAAAKYIVDNWTFTTAPKDESKVMLRDAKGYSLLSGATEKEIAHEFLSTWGASWKAKWNREV